MRNAFGLALLMVVSSGCIEGEAGAPGATSPSIPVSQGTQSRTVDLGSMGFQLGVVPGASIHLGIEVPENASRILVLVEIQQGASSDFIVDGPGECSNDAKSGIGTTQSTSSTFECTSPPPGASEVVLTHRAGWAEGRMSVTAEVLEPTL